MPCPQTDKSYPYLRKADAENPHRSFGQQMREEWKPRCLLGWVWEASGGLGKATDVGDRHRGERVLVEHASHCKASSGHAKTYYCWHDLTSGLTAFRQASVHFSMPKSPPHNVYNTAGEGWLSLIAVTTSRKNEKRQRCGPASVVAHASPRGSGAPSTPAPTSRGRLQGLPLARRASHAQVVIPPTARAPVTARAWGQPRASGYRYGSGRTDRSRPVARKESR